MAVLTKVDREVASIVVRAVEGAAGMRVTMQRERYVLRWATVVLLREYGFSYPMCAKVIGYSEHSSPLDAHKLWESDRRVAAMVEAARKCLRNLIERAGDCAEPQAHESKE